VARIHKDEEGAFRPHIYVCICIHIYIYIKTNKVLSKKKFASHNRRDFREVHYIRDSHGTHAHVTHTHVRATDKKDLETRPTYTLDAPSQERETHTHIAAYCNVLQYTAEYCSILHLFVVQCVLICCSVLQYAAVCCSDIHILSNLIRDKQMQYDTYLSLN